MNKLSALILTGLVLLLSACAENAGQYDFSMPVPQSIPVTDSYFDDAVFIGDSRTQGLILYTGLSNAVCYAYKGLMTDKIFTEPLVERDGQTLSVMDALRLTEFSKIYIMLGINETGWDDSQTFQQGFASIIDGIREINPEAVIYIQEIFPVSAEVSATHDYVKNSKIREYNAILQALAEEKQVYYIDTSNAVDAGDGVLPEAAATDGIHLCKAYCLKWLNYLKTHTAAQKEGGTRQMSRIAVLILSGALLLFAACGCMKRPKNTEASLEALALTLQESKLFGEKLEQVNDEIAGALYNISGASAALVYVASGAVADELALFEFSSEEEARSAAVQAEKRIAAQRDSFAAYLPAEVPKLDRAVIQTYGHCLVVCVSSGTEAQGIIENYFEREAENDTAQPPLP